MSRVLLALGLLVTTAAAAVEEAPQASAHRVLTTHEFEFCTDTGEPRPLAGNAWCALRDEATTCPRLGEMCDLERPVSFFFPAGGGADGEAKKPETKVGEGDTGGALGRLPSRLFEAIDLGALQFLVWAFLGVVLALIVFFVVRALAARRPGAGDEDPVFAAPDQQVTIDEGLGEVALLLRRAQEASSRDPGLALMLLYAALLRHLEERQLIEWDPARTNRDYVRAVRGRSPLARPMADLVREVERVKFGHRAAEQAAFERLWKAVAPQLGAALVMLAGVFGLTGCGDPGLDGTAAFNEIVRAQGYELERWSRPLDTLGPDDPPVVLDTAGLALDAAVLDTVHDAMLGGGRILVLGSRTGAFPSWPNLTLVNGDPEQAAEGGSSSPDEPAPSDSADAGRDDDASVPQPAPSWKLSATALLPDVAGLEGRLPRQMRFVLDDGERDPPEVLFEREGRPFAVRWRSEKGQVVFAADRRLFANGAMAVPANVQLAMALVESMAGDDQTLALASVGVVRPPQSSAQSLGRAGLWLFMLQALLALGLLFWARGAAFGTLRTRDARRRRAFSEHVEAVGLALERHRGSAIAASMYATWALDRLRRRFGREVEGHEPAALARALHRALGDDETSLLRLLEQADLLRREPARAPEPDADLAVIRRLGRILARLQSDTNLEAHR